MDKQRGLFSAQVVGATIVAFLLGFFIAWLFFNYPPKDSGHIAAWVQAFGSIGAICGAVWIAGKSDRNAKNREKMAKTLEIEGVTSVLEKVLHTLKGAESEFESLLKMENSEIGGVISTKVVQVPLEASIEMLRKVPVHEFPYSLMSREIGRRVAWLELIRQSLCYVKMDESISREQASGMLNILKFLNQEADKELESMYKEKDEALRKIASFYADPR